MMRTAFSAISVFLVMLSPMAANAFKIDTHVWVGQQVINDIEADGKITIDLAGTLITLDVPVDVRNAILNNKSDYLMGNIGPDATPDVVVGQSVMHPGDEGVNGAWDTSKWLDYLLSSSQGSSKGSAYVYGYLGHASADVFSHTYVNQYAGDAFNLRDGETRVEERHFMLESYIAKHTPPLRDYLGVPLGSVWDQIPLNNKTVSAAKNDAVNEYASFVRDNLIYDPAVRDQYQLNGVSQHLATFSALRGTVDNIAEDKLWGKINQLILIEVAKYYDYALTPQQSAVIIKAWEKVKDANNKDIDAIQKANTELYKSLSVLDSKVFSGLQTTLNKMKFLEKSWLGTHQKLRAKLMQYGTPPKCPLTYIDQGHVRNGYWRRGHWVRGHWKGKRWRKRYVLGYWTPSVWVPPVWVPRWVLAPNPICVRSRNAVVRANSIVTREVTRLENEALRQKNLMIQKASELKAESTVIIDALFNIYNLAVEMGQRHNADVSPIQSELRGWRADIDESLNEYVLASSQAIVNTTQNAPENWKVPIKKWFDCYAPALIGTPNAVCAVRDQIGKLKVAIDNTVLIIDEMIRLGDPLATQIGRPTARKLVTIRDNLVKHAREAAKKELKDNLPQHIKNIMDLVDAGKHVNGAILNDYFSRQVDTQGKHGGKPLILISDISQRVDAEMSMDVNGYFDPEKYAVAYNAVTLAKLTLLDTASLNVLAAYAGVNASISGTYLFDNHRNIITDSIRSIDGNHQWMDASPWPPQATKYPGVNPDGDWEPGNKVKVLRKDKTYKYSSGSEGFLPWKSGIRDKMFRAMFIGPLSPGIDAPEMLGMSRVVQPDYPYRPCASNPFPNGINDNTCAAVQLAPVTGLLLQ